MRLQAKNARHGQQPPAARREPGSTVPSELPKAPALPASGSQEPSRTGRGYASAVSGGQSVPWYSSSRKQAQ